jgi:hypothetical protein
MYEEKIMDIVGKIIESLENNLEEWEAEWIYYWPQNPWLMALHHPSGIGLRKSREEFNTDVTIEIEETGQDSKPLSSYHKNEQKRITAAFDAVDKILAEKKELELKEHNGNLRTQLIEKVKKL